MQLNFAQETNIPCVIRRRISLKFEKRAAHAHEIFPRAPMAKIDRPLVLAWKLLFSVLIDMEQNETRYRGEIYYHFYHLIIMQKIIIIIQKN